MSHSSSYDELPYSCHPVNWAHPDNLACKALLHGLRSPAAETCRVLELGCGNGANLLSLAQVLPRATLVGIDYSQRQIDQGRAIASTVGLTNVELKALSLADLAGQSGVFDYIICHGVYSWVSSDNQRHILRGIQQHLAPNGVAYVSYNTFPGWHLRGLIREILCYQSMSAGDPTDQVNRARSYLDFLIQYTPEQEGLYAKILQREKEILNKTPDTYVYHEHLEELNQPLYFHEFAEKAAEHQLQFLCEAGFHPEEATFSEDLRKQLLAMARDRIDYEQHCDFLCNGTFRRSLLCHANTALISQPSTLALKHVRIRSRARPAKPLNDLNSNAPDEFLGPHGETVTTTHRLIKAALLCLSEAWPRSMTLDELQDQANVKLDSHPDPIQRLQESELLTSALMRCHRTDLVQISLFEPECAVTVSDRPLAAPLSRWLASRREPICNLMHELVDVDDFGRFVLSLLDGTRDQAALVQAMINHVLQGDITLQQHGNPVSDPEVIAAVVNHSLSKTLDKLSVLRLLVA